jgi:hypothetical protein
MDGLFGREDAEDCSVLVESKDTVVSDEVDGVDPGESF